MIGPLERALMLLVHAADAMKKSVVSKCGYRRPREWFGRIRRVSTVLVSIREFAVSSQA
jgi:hypothetical protein